MSGLVGADVIRQLVAIGVPNSPKGEGVGGEAGDIGREPAGSLTGNGVVEGQVEHPPLWPGLGVSPKSGRFAGSRKGNDLQRLRTGVNDGLLLLGQGHGRHTAGIDVP